MTYGRQRVELWKYDLRVTTGVVVSGVSATTQLLDVNKNITCIIREIR